VFPTCRSAGDEERVRVPDCKVSCWYLLSRIPRRWPHRTRGRGLEPKAEKDSPIADPLAKLILISKNCPPLRKSELEYYAML
jgi:hypothetical protein